jgi:hypothetical protein
MLKNAARFANSFMILPSFFIHPTREQPGQNKERRDKKNKFLQKTLHISRIAEILHPQGFYANLYL